MKGLTFYASKYKDSLPDWLYKILARHYIDFKRPRHLFIETTKRCNFSCTYCPRPKSNEDMDFELFKHIVSQFPARTSFSLHVFGEPLLYPRFREAIEFLSLGRHDINVTTNGYFLERYIDDLVYARANIIWSYHEESNKRISEQTEKKLKTLNFLIRSFDGKVNERWRKWTIPWAYHNYGGTIDQSQSDAKNTIQRWACSHLWFAPAVTVNGKVLACCADPQEQLILGDLSTESITSIWTGEKLRQLREEQLRGEYRSPCDKCNTWKTYRNFW